MPTKKFIVVGDISTVDPSRILTVLTELVGVNAIMITDGGFKVKTTMEGESARELNRAFIEDLSGFAHKYSSYGSEGWGFESLQAH